MTRASIAVTNTVFQLAQNEDIEDLVNRIEAAVHSGGRFVTFTVVGNRTARVLITPTSEVTISTEAVPFDARDTGDTDHPFGAHYDEYA